MDKEIGIFLDLDGCWADTEPAHWASWRDAILPYSIKLTWEDYVKNAIGHTDTEILKQYLKRIGSKIIPKTPEIILRKKLDLYLRIARKNCLVPKQNIKLIKKLKEYRLALVTSSTRAEVEAVIYPTKLKNPFEVIVSSENSAKHKPDPEPYIVAKRLLGVSKGFAFEDAPSGIKSATRARGLKVIKVSNLKELHKLVMESLSTLT